MSKLIKVPENILEMSKKDIQAIAKSMIADEIENPTRDLMKVYIALRKTTELFSGIEKELKESALAEASKYGQKSFEKYGAKITVGNTYTEYDFTNCNDEELELLQEKERQLKQKIQDRKDFLKKLKTPLILVDEKTGEIQKIYPPIVRQTEGIKISY
jgi:Zn-dependent oligopeptidase